MAVIIYGSDRYSMAGSEQAVARIADSDADGAVKHDSSSGADG